MLSLVPFAVGEVLELNGKRVEVLDASHTVPAVGFAVDGGTAGWWVYTGDTGPNPALWERLARMKVAHLVIETAFSDDERQLARISRHLCPAALGHELQHLAGSVDVHITHIKPGERAAVMARDRQARLAAQDPRPRDRRRDAPRRRAEASLRLSAAGRAVARTRDRMRQAGPDRNARLPGLVTVCVSCRDGVHVFRPGGVACALQ